MSGSCLGWGRRSSGISGGGLGWRCRGGRRGALGCRNGLLFWLRKESEIRGASSATNIRGLSYLVHHAYDEALLLNMVIGNSIIVLQYFP